MARLFVCVWPDEPALAFLERVAESLGGRLRATPRSRWHLTLAFLGDADPAAADACLAGGVLPRCAITLDPHPIPVGRDLLAAPVSGAERLAATVAVAVAPVRVEPVERRPYRAHITIGRRAVDGPARSGTLPASRTMTVERVALVESRLTAGGPIYTTLAEYATVAVTGGGGR